MNVYRPADLPDVEIIGKPNARSRRLTLRRDSRDGRFTLAHPKRVSKGELQRFVDQHAEWIKAHYVPVATLDYGQAVPFRGQNLQLAEREKRGVQLDGGVLHVKSVNLEKSIAAFLKSQAQLYAPAKLDHFATLVGKPVNGLRWRDPKSRWGSCDAKGVIMLSWRLIMAPDAVFDYVIAHEVAHLVEMNHSDRFWRVVEEIYPNHQAARTWLKTEGKSLQAFAL